MEKELIRYLSQFVSENRISQFQKVLRHRTRYISVVLENIYHPHNASAVLRSCDCFGVQDVHVIENRHTYQVNPDIALGSSKWLSLRRYNHPEADNTKEALNKLKKEGARILATVADEDAVPFFDIDISQGPVALVLGGEKSGISAEAKEMADQFVTVPMYGFTESLNVSVAAAILLQHFTSEMRKNIRGDLWQLKEDEFDQLFLHWIRKTVKRVELLEQSFAEKKIQGK
ncbi:MAG: TrmH family RNA methyltransferase [Bacteroidota bacterium]